MMKLKLREGDLVQTRQDLIFDVKGLVHPPDRVVAYIRYFPDEKGKRTKQGIHYEKVYPLPQRHRLLKERFRRFLVYDPVFDETLCEVPVDEIKVHYTPSDELKKLRSSENLDLLQRKALGFAQLLKREADVPWNALGISGSIMAELHTATSDVDVVVYGSENCRKVHAALKKFLNNNHELVKPYTLSDLRSLFEFRSKDTKSSFEDFVQTESRKTLQGKFSGTDYFVRCVKEWNEIDEQYGDVQYMNRGCATIEATITDNSESIFTPCNYKIEDARPVEPNVPKSIEEITSFRGRFCEQAEKNEIVIARGKIEKVTDRKHKREKFRLLIGGGPTDYFVLKNKS